LPGPDKVRIVPGRIATGEPVTVGKVVGLFGVRGWVKVYSHTRPTEALLGYRPWLIRLGQEWREVNVAESRVQGKGLVVRIEDYSDRDQAAVLVGAEIALRLAQLPKPKQGEYYWAQLEGLNVINLEGVELGTVSHLFDTGANDVMVVKQGRRERLIPFTKTAIQEVNVEVGVIRVDWDPEF
jgi:16S rRNA processing protein RimM